MQASAPPYLVLGPGCIGVATGVTLSLSRPVRFLCRPSAESEVLRSQGLRLISPEGSVAQLQPAFVFAEEAGAFSGVHVILVATKRSANAQVAKTLARFAEPNAVVVLLQNGLHAATEMRGHLGEARADLVLVNAVVNFNAVKTGPGEFRWVSARADSTIVFDKEPRVKPLAQDLVRAGMDAYVDDDFFAVACGKLLVNLVNAPNALAGVSTYEMFRDGDLRAVWAASVDEAGAVLAKVGVVPRSPRDAENAKIRHLSTLLRVPWFLLGTYLYLAGRKLDGKTSMLQDLEARRETEVDYITGAVSAWARQLGVATPVCDRLAALVRQAQAGGQGSPGMRPAALRAAVGL